MSFFRFDGTTRSVPGLALNGVSLAVLTQPAVTTTQPGTPLATIWTAANSNAPALTGASWFAGFITFALASVPSDVVVGAYLSISGVNPTGYNGIWLISAVSGLNVQVTKTDGTLINPTPGTYVSGGTVATSALPNPFTTDTLGNFFFYATAGIYTLQFYGSALPNQLVLADQNVVAGGGAGSVTSVALTMPAEFSVAGSPIVAGGTLAVSKATQTANLVYAGPSSGGAVVPTFRTLVTADMPAGTGTVTSVAHTLVVPGALLSSAVAGSPVTTTGTLADTITLVNQNANLVFAGATSGGASAPTFRSLVAADIPGTLLQTVSIPLSSAQILALLGTPVTLVAAPGAGFTILPVTILLKFFGGGVAYTDAGGAVSFNCGTMSAALANNNIFLVTVSPNKRLQSFPWPGATDTAGNPPTDDNAALTISKVTNNFAAGTGTATIIVQYLILSTT